MGNTVDFNKIRRRRRLTQNVKRLLMLALVVGAVAGIVLLNALFVEKGLSVKVSDLIESMGGDGFPTDMPGGIVRDMKGMGNNLLLLNDTNLFLYNKKAKIVTNVQRMSSKTVMTANDNRVLTYETGGKIYRIHTPSQTYEAELENSIVAADMGQDNTFALVTTSRQRVAEVAVYKNHTDSHVFLWASPEDHLYNVALSPKCNLMAVASVTTSGGVLKSVVNLFNLGMEDKLAEAAFEDSLILEMHFYTQDRVAVLTDREYCILDTTGKKLGSYPVDGVEIIGFDFDGKHAVLLTENKEARRWQAILLDDGAKVTATKEMSSRIRDAEVDNKRVYLHTDSGISAYDHDFKLDYSLPLRGISRMEMVGGRVYYCTDEQICILERPEEPKPSSTPESSAAPSGSSESTTSEEEPSSAGPESSEASEAESGDGGEEPSASAGEAKEIR
ncbi:DUF5711 family protein [Ruminococcaceae bacterium OttesenSCG-928-L11]|nr:DUF5711 family protein [Ruminococcaceae bacterium OttesenSCG-928-L11]